MTPDPRAATRRNNVIVAGHQGDDARVRNALDDPDPAVRSAALGALARLDQLDDNTLERALRDPVAAVRRRAVEIAATHPTVSLLGMLDDTDATVVEVAAWSCGEHVAVDDDVLARLIAIATGADEPLVREAATAALGAIGDPRGLPAVLAACDDKPHIRRRAVLALAPFEGDEVEAAIDRALADRDWQVRQAAEDLRRAAGA